MPSVAPQRTRICFIPFLCSIQWFSFKELVRRRQSVTNQGCTDVLVGGEWWGSRYEATAVTHGVFMVLSVVSSRTHLCFINSLGISFGWGLCILDLRTTWYYQNVQISQLMFQKLGAQDACKERSYTISLYSDSNIDLASKRQFCRNKA